MKIFLIIFALALFASSCGFRKYVWFISLGYGAAIALIGVGLLFIFSSELTLVTVLQCVLLIVYGCRLSGISEIQIFDSDHDSIYPTLLSKRSQMAGGIMKKNQVIKFFRLKLHLSPRYNLISSQKGGFNF